MTLRAHTHEAVCPLTERVWLTKSGLLVLVSQGPRSEPDLNGCSRCEGANVAMQLGASLVSCCPHIHLSLHRRADKSQTASVSEQNHSKYSTASVRIQSCSLNGCTEAWARLRLSYIYTPWNLWAGLYWCLYTRDPWIFQVSPTLNFHFHYILETRCTFTPLHLFNNLISSNFGSLLVRPREAQTNKQTSKNSDSDNQKNVYYGSDKMADFEIYQSDFRYNTDVHVTNMEANHCFIYKYCQRASVQVNMRVWTATLKGISHIINFSAGWWNLGIKLKQVAEVQAMKWLVIKGYNQFSHTVI